MHLTATFSLQLQVHQTLVVLDQAEYQSLADRYR
jgi:hypothetical protein